MKKIFLLMIVALFTITVRAQSYTTVDLYDYPENISYGDNGYYFKDTQGYFDQYLGNWQYESGNLKIQIRFVKKSIMRTFSSGSFKKDILVGGMRILKNNVEVMNTVPSVNQTKDYMSEYYIYDGVRLFNNEGNCYNCTVPEQRIKMYYQEPDNDNRAFTDLFFRMHVYMNAQNQPTLRLEFTQAALQGMDPNWYDTEYGETAPTKTTLHLPFGTYDFVKLN
ncbi:MAG TPA: DUF6705 family protein [Flavobacterium sp.]|nr:DUF6705 family protein [Flavobacterium sp.]